MVEIKFEIHETIKTTSEGSKGWGTLLIERSN